MYDISFDLQNVSLINASLCKNIKLITVHLKENKKINDRGKGTLEMFNFVIKAVELHKIKKIVFASALLLTCNASNKILLYGTFYSYFLLSWNEAKEKIV